MLLPRASLAVIYVPLLVVLVSGAMAGAAASGGAPLVSAPEPSSDRTAIVLPQNDHAAVCAVDPVVIADPRESVDPRCMAPVASADDDAQDARALTNATVAR